MRYSKLTDWFDIKKKHNEFVDHYLSRFRIMRKLDVLPLYLVKIVTIGIDFYVGKKLGIFFSNPIAKNIFKSDPL